MRSSDEAIEQEMQEMMARIPHMDQIKTRMTDLQQSIDEMIQCGTPDPEALMEIQQQIEAIEQEMQQRMAR